MKRTASDQIEIWETQPQVDDDDGHSGIEGILEPVNVSSKQVVYGTEFGVKHSTPNQNTHNAGHRVRQDDDGSVNPSTEKFAIHSHGNEQS